MSRSLRLIVALAVALAAQALPSMPTAVADAAGIGGDFVPLATPFRALNTTSGAKKGPESTTNVKVTGVGGVPAAGVSAVLVDVSTQAPSAATWLALWETGKTRPGLVNLWVAAGSPGLSNTATVPVSDTGQISVWNQEGSVHIVVDIQGYFTETTGGTGKGGFVPVQQTTIVDGTEVAAKASLTVQISGSLVPATATSAFLGVRVAATSASWINAYPAGGTMGNSVIDYEAGASSSGVSVKLGTGGKVVFVNRGDAAINLFLTVQGYFSNTPALGAGFRKGAGRLVSGLTLASNAITDVAVGGRYGLPTRAIAGAAINFSTLNTAGSGSLRVWPVGGTEPTVRANVTTYPQDAVRGSMAIVKPGTEAKIRVRNVSQHPVQIWLDLLGWFADPLPAVPVRPDTPITAMQLPPAAGAQVGFIEYAYVDNIGRIMHGHQADLNSFSTITWTPVSGNDGYTGQPALTYLQNGAVQIAAQNFDSNIHALTQSALYPTPAWSPWAELGGSMAEPPTLARLPSGASVLFAIDADGRLWHRMQNEYWRSLGDLNLVGSVTVATVDGALQLFALDTTGALRTTTYTDGVVSAWSSLGGSGLTGSPAVVVYPGFKLRVFVRTATGTIVTKYRDAATGPFPATWSSVGTIVAAGSPSAVLSPTTGRTELVVRGTDGKIYSVGETAPGSGAWRPEKVAYDGVAVTDPTAFGYTNVTGRWAVVFRDQDRPVALTVDET
jgi:hypothetical protein